MSWWLELEMIISAASGIKKKDCLEYLLNNYKIEKSVINDCLNSACINNRVLNLKLLLKYKADITFNNFICFKTTTELTNPIGIMKTLVQHAKDNEITIPDNILLIEKFSKKIPLIKYW